MAARPETEEGASQRTSTTSKDPLIGRTIDGRFHVSRLIARGGMGKVYLAEQSPLGRPCALKVLDPNSDADPEFCRRFFREASTAARLTHPNTVTVFDYGRTSDDIYYIAMEYLEGKTLHRAIRDAQGMEESRVISVASQVCRSLREAHALGIVHRDLKPANVLLVRHGDEQDFVKVLDFGLVKQLGESPDEQLTQTGLFMGSPKYMAPEQIHGNAVDARTDVYALGVMMYEMLTGRVPFDRPTNVGVLMAHVSEAPPRLVDTKPDVVCSPALEHIVMRCLEKDPENRISSMGDLLSELRKSVGLPTGETPHTYVARAVRAPLASDPNPASRLESRAALPSESARQSLPSGASIMPVGLDSLDMEHLFASYKRKKKNWGQRVLPATFAVAAIGIFLGVCARSGFTLDPADEADLIPKIPRTLKQRGARLADEVISPLNGAVPAVSAGAAAPGAGHRVHIATDPAGARVTEDGTPRCEKTPCDVTFGDDAEHTLTISRPGYKSETKTVKSHGSVDIALTKQTAAAAPRDLPRPAPSPNKAAAANAEARRESTATATPVPSGYKDIE